MSIKYRRFGDGFVQRVPDSDPEVYEPVPPDDESIARAAVEAEERRDDDDGESPYFAHIIRADGTDEFMDRPKDRR